jgi:hypothetical protein
MRSWSLATFPSTTRNLAQRNRGVDDDEMVKSDRIAVCFDIGRQGEECHFGLVLNHAL